MGLNVVILVPRRADGGRRDLLWRFTSDWLTKFHPQWRIVEGESPDGPFNRGAALNQAARDAGDWDVAIVHDGDNITSPAVLEEAVDLAIATGITHIAHDTYMYLDQDSSDEILISPLGPWWPRPQIYNVRDGYAPFIIHKHVSGVVVIPRTVWTATNGFVELRGWGSDDSLHIIMCNALGGGVEWVKGTAFHFWHDHAPQDSTRIDRVRNRQQMLQAKQYERRRDATGLRRFLATLGHQVP